MKKASVKLNNKKAMMLNVMEHFIENTPPARLSKNLRNLLIEHLAVHKDGYSFNLDDLLLDMLNLFELLDATELIMSKENS